MLVMFVNVIHFYTYPDCVMLENETRLGGTKIYLKTNKINKFNCYYFY